ncbi:glycosyltransferase family 2 protein [Salinivibrio proteolyticus]|uniref:Glycosyltransferase family 2 protein n=1 Tax=Salinivibrio proteolyticus TaxID=334715 RepID=A0ABY7LBH5_9GAMM|nr:glycosyltransferase family 2 protein [Salinivibrio proteolyticus]WBA13977.1 glycosyltransferase family 2 protein [Salinivibrio proteolyticus]
MLDESVDGLGVSILSRDLKSMENRIDFTFGIITYNHSDYILEHLESIKYQILNYGKGAGVKLVVSDDGSSDNTLEIIKKWISYNADLFMECIILGDGVNRGVGHSFTNIWKHIGDEAFKVLAGDDVYSYENIFLEANLLEKYDFVSGLPLLLIDGKILYKKNLMFHLYATQHIYKNKTLLSKIKNISVINTPSLLYRNKFIKDKSVFDFIRQFRVTEDFPMMASLSSIYPKLKFFTSDRVYIYYRRTKGSIYIVDSERYNKDKEDVFKYLINVDKSYIGRFLTRNRLFCYKAGGRIGKVLNIGYYIYLLRLLMALPKITSSMRGLRIDEEKHRTHYKKIVERARRARWELKI